MQPRIKYDKANSDAYRAMLGVEKYLSKCDLEKSLLDLIKLHVSQINGCAFCIDMHWKDARARGESEQRLYGLPAWAESPYYTERERAALAWAEEMTRLPNKQVSDEAYQLARAQFNDKDLVDLTWAVSAINAWNRLNIALRTEAGNYQPPTLS